MTKPTFYLLWLLSVMLLGCQTEAVTEVEKPAQPNIIYILADDLGYGELGSYGQQIIETPNLDNLAQQGMTFSNHYSGAPVCAPARCVLLTGKHAGHAYIRGNDEWRERGAVWDYQAMFENPNLEGQRPIPEDSVTIGDLLKTAGYQTAIIGKWGLGGPMTEGIPNRQGFDYFYGYNCQRQAHTLFPLHLWENEEKIRLNNPNIAPHSKLEDNADPLDSIAYQKFTGNDYAPALMLNAAQQFITQNKDQPFFLYFASPLPHVPLQAPKKWVDYYRKKLGDEAPYPGNGNYFPSYTPRATYAAMISYLDEQVGSLIQTLRETGQFDNTIILFSSDNGPTYAGGADTPFFESASPFPTERGRGKGYVYEGGIRVPFIASWPGKIQPGSQSNHVSAFWDMLPTICELAGVPSVPKRDGISLVPTLLQEGKQPRHEYLYWEFPAYKGQQAVRIGHWKGVRQGLFDGNMTIELYDLSIDSIEAHNIADEHPDIVAKIAAIMEKAHEAPVLEKFRIPALGD